MTGTSVSIAATRFAEALDLARIAVRHTAKVKRAEEFALTGDGKLLFHGQEIPGDVLWTISADDKRAVLEHIVTAAEIEIEELRDEDEEAA